MIHLEAPRKFSGLVAQAHQVAAQMFRPISRQYDRDEHAEPKELLMLASLLDGMNAAGAGGGAGAAGAGRERTSETGENRNGSNLSTVLGIMELCWGDVGL